MNKSVVAAPAFALALSGCVGAYTIDDLDPGRVRPLAAERNIPGKYAVAVVGNLGQPVTGTTTWTRNVGPQMSGAELTFHVGEPLRKAVAAAVSRSFVEPVFVGTEDEARTLARNGSGAIIVRYGGGETGGDLRQTHFTGYITTVHVVLNGEVEMLAPGAAETVRRVEGRGGSASEGGSLTYGALVVPVAKAAAEMAIAEFAERAVREAAFVFSK
jgi:hypothetical protein